MNFSGLPLLFRLRHILLRSREKLQNLASESWQIAPRELRLESAIFAMPGQFERVTKLSEFSLSFDEELARLRGGREILHGATHGYLIRDALLADGVLYKQSACLYLHAARQKLPSFKVEHERSRAALYASFQGNRYFAHWLMDDCVTYAMALEYGQPVSTAFPPQTAQMGEYADLLGVRAQFKQNCRFDELVVFDDNGQNSHKHQRFRDLGCRLLRGKPANRHAGVFVLRGTSGNKRLLSNEMALAEHLNAKYGLRIVAPERMSASEIIQLCAGSELVVGVEGSQLIHGILMLVEDGSLLVLQPPNRYSSIYKDLTDRDRQKFGVVVGLMGDAESGFTVDAYEVDATIDLMQSAG